jgi:hypothetical protein
MWQLDGTTATWNARFQLDLQRPGSGIVVSNPGRDASGLCLLQVQLKKTHAAAGLKLADAYVRGRDCIATYAPLPPDQVQPQIYWRGSLNEQPGCCGIEMVLSMQTSLLDSDPLIDVVSDLPAGEQFAWNNEQWQSQSSTATLSREAGHSGLVLLQPQGGSWSYAQGVFPADYLRTETQLDQSSHQAAWASPLFAERLEKGVIRRGRIAGWVMPRERDQELAVALWNAFCQSPPPLTA